MKNSVNRIGFWRAIRIFAFILLFLFAIIAGVQIVAMVMYGPEYVYRNAVWGPSTYFTYTQKFPSHPLNASQTAYHFNVSPDPRVQKLFGQLSGSDDWNSFLENHNTQAFIVTYNGTVVYENYFNGASRDSIVTSFSVAKSVTSVLIGMAIQDGYIKSVNDPITNYLPELSKRDPRFNNITIQNLLRMSSGLDYKAKRSLIFTEIGDDSLTTFYPNQRKLALTNTRIIDPSGQYFLYNKYHPQLLGMILERTTGMSVTKYLQTKIWNPLGMEYGGSWSIDSKSDDFEKMEAGVNARAIDFAKFGELFLNNGSWQGNQIISKEWVDESTRPYLPENYTFYYHNFLQNYNLSAQTLNGTIYYNYMWWGVARPDGSYDFFALGDHGQFIYVSPQKHLVIIRNGLDYGIPFLQWIKLFYDFASKY